MSGESLESLIQHLEHTGVLQTPGIKAALLAIDRREFIPEHIKHLAYKDHPIVLAEEQTISQPTTVVFMLEQLDIQPGNRILDVGGGSGWVSCLMGKLAQPEGEVFAFEINEIVGMMGMENVERCRLGNVQYMIGDAADYWDNHMPYDRIHAAAAFREIPGALTHLLKPNGILVAPTQDGYIKKITRVSEQEFVEEEFYGFAFVPFVER